MTPKQQAFCEEYLKDFNATRAYKEVYSSVKNDETAAAAASRMLNNVKVKEYIEKVNKVATNSRILTLEQIKEFYSSVIGNEDAELKDRITAADKLSRYVGLNKIEKEKLSIEREKLEIDKMKHKEQLEKEETQAEAVGNALLGIVNQLKTNGTDK